MAEAVLFDLHAKGAAPGRGDFDLCVMIPRPLPNEKYDCHQKGQPLCCSNCQPHSVNAQKQRQQQDDGNLEY